MEMYQPGARQLKMAIPPPPPARHDEEDDSLFQELEASAVPLHAEIEASQPVPAQAVRPAAHDDGARLVHLHHLMVT